MLLINLRTLFVLSTLVMGSNFLILMSHYNKCNTKITSLHICRSSLLDKLELINITFKDGKYALKILQAH